MESANHEFTWLSGRAHTSVGREARGEENIIPSENSSTFWKTTSILNVVGINSSNKSDEKATTKPTPVPRIFRRVTTLDHAKSTSTPLYEVPPTSEHSVFYVATPKDNSSDSVKSHDAPPLAPPPPALRVDDSIILEFDPILQKREQAERIENNRLSSLRLSTLNVSLPAPENSTFVDNYSGHVYQELEPPADDHEIRSIQQKMDADMNDPSSIYDVPRKAARTYSNASSNVSCASLKMSSTTNSSPSSTSSRHRACDIKRSNGDEPSGADAAIVSVPLTTPPISPSPTAPIPKPRTIMNLKCSLSFVLPPPSKVYQDESTHEDPSNLPYNAPNLVFNDLYMYTENGSFDTKSESVEATKVSAAGFYHEERRCADRDGSGFDPPSYPPPLPPTNCNDAACSGINDQHSTGIEKTPRAIQLRASPEKPPRTDLRSIKAASTSVAYDLAKQTHNPGTESKWKIPLYHNLQDLMGEKGVYGKINKLARGTILDRPQEPPPLPPRGQQQHAPGLKILADMLASKKGSASGTVRNTEFTTYVLSDEISSDRISTVVDNCRNIRHHGMLYRVGKGRKDICQKWVVLERGHLQCYDDDKTDCAQEIFHKSDIVSVAKGADVKFSNFDLNCFEVVSISTRDRLQVFGARYLSDREVWMKHLVQSLAPLSDLPLTCSGVVKAGFVFLRKSVTGSFQVCWLVLHGRQLDVHYDDSDDYFYIDLRKVISMQEFEQDPQMSAMSDEGPVFVIHVPSLTIYIRSTVPFDTLNWYQRILAATKQTGAGLENQQLTHEDVPVIVDKCIKFVSTYGLTSKGIYRESATNSKITKLLESFYKDAQKTDLKVEDHTEHEVANVLKRFFRQLPDPLLTKVLYPQWMAAVADDSLENYKCLLDQLPKINYHTLKRIVAHLRSVSEQSEFNLMPSINLAQAFGATLLAHEKDISLSNSPFECDVMIRLIENYFSLFGVSDEEIEKEEIIQRALKDLRDAKMAQKPAGDILVGIYIYSRQMKCLNIKLSPSMTAYELCKHATQQTRMRERPENLSVFEVVCGGDLERPLHHSEIVLSVTLRWATWAEADAKDNYLVIKSNDMLHRIFPLTRQPLSTFGELKFATVKSKTFKKLLFEFKNARLAYYKDAKVTQPLEAWNIEDITWYIGAESKRAAPWSITFIEEKAVVKRGSKEAPYFGRQICFSTEEEFNKWVASMLIGQYPNGILPKADHFDLLTQTGR